MDTYQKIVHQLEQGQLYLLTVVSEQYFGEKCILQGDTVTAENNSFDGFWKQAVSDLDTGRVPCLYHTGGNLVFAERILEEPQLVICGGGHISLELAALAVYMEYPFSVLDDREEFCCMKRFPGAKQCICKPFEEGLSCSELGGNPYYVIATRGHSNDLQCLEIVLNRPYGYIGMIGSRGKVQKSMDYLREKGFHEDILNEVHSPIGLRIGGQTPKEIAVSIMAELIQVKNQQQPASYLEAEFKHRFMGEKERMVLVKIIEKEGSAPRGAGAKMLVGKDGILCGTIGGGTIEFEAEKRAIALMDSGGCALEEYHLNHSTAAALGMWCGGRVKVFFECLNEKPIGFETASADNK